MVKVVFFGSGNFVKPVRQILKENFEVVPQDGDLAVVASYGKILSKEDIDSFPYGVLNIHPSLLPKYRGPTPVQTAILNGDKKTGVTIIKIDEKVDHGPILSQEELEISENETSESLLRRTFELGAKMLPNVLSNYIKRQIKLSPQDDSKATYTQHLTKNDGFLDFENYKLSIIDNKLLDRRIRAFFPWPGIWFKTKLNGKEQTIKLLPEQKIQVEGKKPMSYKDFINGYSEGRKILEKLGQLDN